MKRFFTFVHIVLIFNHLMKNIVFKGVLLLASILIFSCENKAQKQHQLSGAFSGPISISKVEIQQFGLEMKTVFDTIVTENKFKMNIPKQLPTGMYKILYYEGEANSSFDFFITNNESVDFNIELSKTKFNAPIFTNSEINTTYYKVTEKNGELFAQLNSSKGQWAAELDKTSAKADSLAQSIKQTLKDQEENFATISSDLPFLKLIIKNSFPSQFFDAELTPRQQDSVNFSTYWSKIDANNADLLNSSVLASSIYNYINFTFSFYTHLPHKEQVKKTEEAVDYILKQFTDAKTRKFAIDYLSFGFTQLGREDILKYIDLNYASVDQCENPDKLKVRLEGYEKIKAGNPAPELVFEGENILNSITDTTLVVYWATWCTHCQQEIPQLYQFQGQTKMKVIAISLDTDKKIFEDVEKQLPNFTHYCDFLEWNSPNVKNYYVKGTPTFVLIDPNKNIIGKYISINDVMAELF
ncbi:MAG: TlpA family protein disulfide reductase [Flavobacteriales bacterium]